MINLAWRLQALPWYLAIPAGLIAGAVTIVFVFPITIALALFIYDKTNSI